MSSQLSTFNPQQLWQHFDTLAETPDAVAKLRRFILDLAVNGRLSESSSHNNPEKQNLGSVIELISGQHLTPEEYNEDGDGIPYLTGPADFGPRFPKASRWTTTPKVTASKGDILLTVKGAGVGKTNVVIEKEMAISRQLMAVRSKGIDADFIELSLRAAFAAFQAASNGIAIPGISRDDVLKHSIWVPPLAEQRRIVVKVEDLLALCDELEARQTAVSEHRTRLVRSALDHLTTAQDEADFKKHSSFCIQYSELLFDSVPALRQAILSLAVQGYLVPQNSKDKPASELLEQIGKERGSLVAKKKLGASPRMKINDLPTKPLPKGWMWSPFGDVTFCRDGERIPVNRDERENLAKTYDYYGASGVIDKIDRFLFDTPLLLIGEDGANLINRSTPIAFIAEGKYWVNNHAHVLDTINRALMEYLRIYINAINLEGYITGMAQPKMNQAQMNSIPIALPPLAEQQRIVAKVDELMRWCDALEARLTAARTTATRLLDATLHQILAA